MEIIKHHKTALLFGATGLVGSHCLEFLLAHEAYQRVVVFSRRPVKRDHPKLVSVIVDFSQLSANAADMRGDDVFICLGTTRAKAGSAEAFREVDLHYNLKIAKLALAGGCKQLLLVSSVGADPDSPFLYPRTKGELEVAISAMPFWAVHIFQPSFLLGERNENRWGEKVAGMIGGFFDRISGGMLTKYRPIEAEVVAQSMVSAAQQLQGGVQVHASHELQALADLLYNQA
ncbi:MAG: oxidoreductase [Lewinellaceae bacterium]|nr:oxidoreductase [Lewinellaceae bacterium]